MRSLSISSRKIRRGAVFLLRTLLVFDALIERFCDGVTSGTKSDMACMGCRTGVTFFAMARVIALVPHPNQPTNQP